MPLLQIAEFARSVSVCSNVEPSCHELSHHPSRRSHSVSAVSGQVKTNSAAMPSPGDEREAYLSLPRGQINGTAYSSRQGSLRRGEDRSRVRNPGDQGRAGSRISAFEEPEGTCGEYRTDYRTPKEVIGGNVVWAILYSPADSNSTEVLTFSAAAILVRFITVTLCSPRSIPPT